MHVHTQLSSTGVAQLLATTISTGVEELCDCGFSANSLNQITLQCFPDNQEKINILLLLQQTPTKNISEIITLLNTWISSNPLIVLDDSNTTLSFSSDCDIEKIQGSECNPSTQTPTLSTMDSPSPSNVAYNQTPTENSNVAAEEDTSKGEDIAIAGGVLLTIAMIGIAAVLITIVGLVRCHVIKTGSFNM